MKVDGIDVDVVMLEQRQCAPGCKLYGTRILVNNLPVELRGATRVTITDSGIAALDNQQTYVSDDSRYVILYEPIPLIDRSVRQ